MTCPICRKRHSALEPTNLPSARNIQVLLDIKKQFTSTTCAEQCQRHEEDLKIFCLSCHEPICLECLMDDHKDHAYQRISETYQKHKEEVISELAILEEKIDEIEIGLASIQIAEQSIEDSGKLVKADINQHAEELISKLNENRKQLIEIVDNTVALKVELYRQQKQIIQSKVMHLIDIKDHVDESLKSWSKSKLVLNKTDLLTMMGVVNDKGYQNLVVQPMAQSIDLVFIKLHDLTVGTVIQMKKPKPKNSYRHNLERLFWIIVILSSAVVTLICFLL